ncbi:Zinc finger protein zpr1 [Thalictrum thalictroides]|uniref:Zinc finger protein zpr1 n=1 Tax=Thalictrum thalictroides TaxID=46969 RepID=A0A7J6UW35_THATH|nr:Zinc finger protein zpr1 [Thalictrum thalictroides]
MESTNPIIDVGSAAEAVSADDISSSSAQPLHEIESLCMRCGENGTTRLLLTRIPHFREVVLMAFECSHCNERNNEVQFAGELQPKGRRYQLQIQSGDQTILNRQVVKSDSATIKIPELDFEIPPEAQRGTLSTVEGILMRAVNELEALQDERKKVDPEKAEALDKFLIKLKSLATGEMGFSFVLDDPSGNSFIENPFAPAVDPALSIKYYERTPEQQEALGFQVEAQSDDEGIKQVPHGSVGAAAFQRSIAQGNTEQFANSLFKYSAPEEVMTFPSTCGTCGARSEARMYVTKIPYFQEVIVMASSCDACGYRSSELKAGGQTPAKGKKITVLVQNKDDLSRDVIKSDNASVTVPELDLELTSGTLGGMVTTIEGLITQIGENLDKVHGFNFGDSTDEWNKIKWKDFKSRLSKLLDVEEPWTLILDDGLAGSFVSPITDAIEDDHQLKFEDYERSWEQNEELGLNDIDTSAADVYYDSTTTT